jgi:FkbM family methyltransferase
MKSYSHVDCNGIPLDEKLDTLFAQKTGGFYIEMGAHDGLFQSNTARLEFSRGWSGVLIEPSKNVYDACVVNRPRSKCFNCACVSTDYKEPYILGNFTGEAMASVNGLRQHATNLVSVKATTLTSILDSVVPPIKEIDLLSLDVEGYERAVLDGLDFSRYRPKYMLIEVYAAEYDATVYFLAQKGYALHSSFSNYSKQTNPGWDGTHNDYLFVDIKRTS